MLFKKILTFIKKIIALFLFLFNPRKQAIENNLEKIGVFEHKGRLSFKTYYNLFNSYLMLFMYTIFKKKPRFIIHNEEYIKNGKVFGSIHYGPWDVALRLAMERYSFVSVVGKRDLLNILREKQGIRLLYSSDGFKKILKVAQKERVTLMLDRTFYERGIYIPVGNSYLKISRAAITLSQRLKEDMYFITTKGEDGVVEIFIDKIPYGSFNEMVKKIINHINSLLVGHPEWWFNFFASWR